MSLSKKQQLTIAFPQLEEPTAEQPPVSTWEFLMLAGIVLIAIAFRFYGPEQSLFTLHTARDMYRSLLLVRGEEIPLLGSEMQYGGRVLGPLMYFLIAPIVAITPSPVGVFYLIAFMNTALLVILWRIVRGIFGSWVAILAIALYAVFPLEIGQLRFNWNPCFLPFMLTIALGALWRVTVFREKWPLFVCILFLVFGLQLHFSTMQAIIVSLIILIVARVKPSANVLIASIIAVILLFLPLVINEVTTDSSNLQQVVEAGDSERQGVERFAFNPNGIKNFFYHVRLDFHEENHELGFSVLESVELIGPVWIGPKKMMVAKIINGFAQIQIVFWFIGFLYCINRVVEYYGNKEFEEHGEEALHKMIPFLTLVLFQIIPVLVLAFFNYHGKPGDPPGIAPIRYYLVTYPTPFITSALGIVLLCSWARKNFESIWGQHIVLLLVAGLLGSHMVFNVLYIQVIERSGRFQPYNLPNVTPNYASMKKFRDVLLGDAGLDRDAYYERVHAQNVATWHYGEATLDYLITQDKRSVTNESPDENLRWLLHSPVINHPGMPDSPDPVLPEGAEETRRWTWDDDGFTVVEYKVDDPDEPLAPEHEMMRNYYFTDVRMLYLGPERNIREQTSLEK